MDWGEFQDAVNSHLAVEANRRGMEAFRERYMRNAVLDLQRYIRGYRVGNTTVYGPDDVTNQGQAQLVEFPTGAKPKAVYIYSVDAELDSPLCYRYRLQFYPWLSRQDLICGRLNFSNWWAGCACNSEGCSQVPMTADQQQAWTTKAYVYTIGPMGRNFLIYPQITESTRLLLVWDGYKYTWSDSDTINFPEEASEAVAAYVQAKITRNVDKNLALSREFEADYVKLRLALYRDFIETQDMEEKDDEYGANSIPPPTNFSEFDAQSIPLLRTITTIAGSGVTALEAISTVSMDTPTSVMLIISGVLQLWVLTSGTNATAPGVQRPADFNATTNPKVWIQLS
jgi:hypothetical protein